MNKTPFLSKFLTGRKTEYEAGAREFYAEALEARILYSAAPVEVSPEQSDHVVPDIKADEDFVGINDFAQSSEISAGPGDDAGELVSLTSAQNLTEAELAILAEAAEQYWLDSGIDDDQLAALKLIEYKIVDLESNILGVAEGFEIEIDIDAAGEGWFIDSTPFKNEEFGNQQSLTALRATEGEAVYGIDLLSVLIHEQGHVLGLEDIYESVGKSNVMYGFFEEGERRLAADGQAAEAEPLSLEGPHFAEVPVAGDDAISTDQDTVVAVTATDSARYENVVTGDDPVAYYRLNELSGSSVATDQQGGNAGTATNVTFGESGILPGVDPSQGSAEFNKNGRISIDYDASLNPAGSFSFEAWVDWDGTGGYQSVITSRGGNGEGYILYKHTDGNWSFWTSNGGANWDQMHAPSAAISNESTYLVGTFEADGEDPNENGYYTGTKILYINGVEVGRNESAYYKPNESSPTHIGAGNSDGSNFYFDGHIDEVAIYDQALTDEDVAERYNIAHKGGLLSNDTESGVSDRIGDGGWENGNEPVLINPVSVTLNQGSEFYSVDNLIGQLSGLDLSNYADATFESGQGTSWVTDAVRPDYFDNGGTNPVLTFGLDSVQTLTHFVYWGYGGNDNEAKDFTLEFSADGGATFSDPVTVSSVTKAGSGQNTLFLGAAYEADTVRITITDNYSDNRVGLGEVKFISKGTLEVVAVNGDNSAVGNTAFLPSGAEVTVESDGSYSYDPNSAFDYLGDGETATDFFTYTINDGYGNSETATVTITVEGKNDAPVAADDSNYAFEAGGIENGTQQVGGDGSTASGTSGSVFAQVGAEIALTPPTSLIQGSIRNDAGNSTEAHLASLTSDTFTYDPLDPTSDLPTTAYSTRVNPAVGIHGNGDGDLIFDLSFNNPVTLGAETQVVVDLYGRNTNQQRDNDIDVLFMAANGTVLGRVNGVAIADGSSPHVRVSSAGVVPEGAEIAKIRIVGHDSDGSPEVSNDFTLLEVRAAEITGDYDPDHSDQTTPLDGSVKVTGISFDGTPFQSTNSGGSVAAGTSSADGAKIDGAYGTLTIGADGTYTYLLDPDVSNSLAAGEVKEEVFTYTIDDGFDGDSATLTITVTGANDAPTLTQFDSGVESTSEDTNVDITFAGLVASGDESDVDGTVAGFVVKSVTGGTLTIGGAAFDAVTNNIISSTSSAVWKPEADVFGAGINAFTVVAIDNAGAESALPVQVTVDVSPVNDAPDFTIAPSHTSDEDAGDQSVANFAGGFDKGAANESDQNLSFEIVSNTNATLFACGPTISSDGTLNYTAATNAHGSATIEVRVKDDGGGADSSAIQSFNIVITPVNDAPVANDDTGSAGENETTSFDVTGNDTDIDEDAVLAVDSIGAVTVVSSNATVDGIDAASAFSIDGTSQVAFDPGTLFDALAQDDSATVTVQYTVRDQQGATSVATLTVTVNGTQEDSDPLVGISSLFTTFNIHKLFGSLSQATAIASNASGDVVGQEVFDPGGSNFLSNLGTFMDSYSGYRMILRVSGFERDDILSIISAADFGDNGGPDFNFDGNVLEVVASLSGHSVGALV